MNTRVTYRVFRAGVIAAALLVGWGLGWIQFGRRGYSRGATDLFRRGACVATQEFQSDTKPRNSMGEAFWRLPDDDSETGKGDIVVLEKLHYDPGPGGDTIVELAIVNMGSEDVVVDDMYGLLALRFHGPGDSTREQEPTDRIASTQPIAPTLEGTEEKNRGFWLGTARWILGDGHIGRGGAGLVSFHMPSRTQGLTGYPDKAVVYVCFITVNNDGRTQHYLHFAHQRGGNRVHRIGSSFR